MAIEGEISEGDSQKLPRELPGELPRELPQNCPKICPESCPKPFKKTSVRLPKIRLQQFLN
jgi:hypothetical protein